MFNFKNAIMKTIKNLRRLNELHNLIEQECTGSPKQLAQRLYVSERLIYCLIEQLRDYGAEVQYDRGRRTYFYKADFQFHVNISVAVGDHNGLTQIYAG